MKKSANNERAGLPQACQRTPGAEAQRREHAGRNPRSRTRERRARQGEFAFRTWGGARRGAGRKPKGERALVPHDARPAHKARFPLLITSRMRPGLPSLRRAGEAALIRAALASARRDAEGSGQEAAPIPVVYYSIQSNHLHLIVEAEDRAALTSGMRGLLVRIARGLNRLWGRSGSAFADRFHERELRNPRQVRNALVYVLQNLRKHGIHLHGPDPLSSGPEFDGWDLPEARGSGLGASDRAAQGGGAGLQAPIPWLRAARAGASSPKTWLLNVGWRRHGLIDPGEWPRAH